MSNLSLSNLLVTTGVDLTAPFSACNLYAASNLSATPPGRGSQLNIGFFRGLTVVAAAPVTGVPSTANLVAEVLFGTQNLPTTDTTGKTLTISPTPPTVVNDTTRGYVASFAGSRYITINSFDLPQSYTKSALIYLTGSQSITGNIISSFGSGTTKHYWWFHNNINLGAGHGTQLQAFVSDPNTTPQNVWVHYVLTYDNPSQTMRLYRNGTLVSSNTSASLNWSGGSGAGVQIGAFANNNNLIGYIDNARVWNKALSDAEVLSLYNADVQ